MRIKAKIACSLFNSMKFGICRMRRIYIDVLIYRKSCCLLLLTAAMPVLHPADTLSIPLAPF